MKIMQVANGYPPRDRSGTPVYAGNLARELARRYQVYVFHPCEDRNRSRYSVLRSEVNSVHKIEITTNHGPASLMLASLASPESTYRDDKLEKVFGAILDQVRPDVVHFQHVINLSASLLALCKGKGIPIVLTLHDFWFVCHRSHLLREGDAICAGPIGGRTPDCIRCQADYSLATVSRFLSRYIGLAGTLLNNRVASALLAWLLALSHGKDVYVKRNAFLREAAQYADVVITPSRFVHDRFLDFGLAQVKIVGSAMRMESPKSRFRMATSSAVEALSTNRTS